MTTRLARPDHLDRCRMTRAPRCCGQRAARPRKAADASRWGWILLLMGAVACGGAGRPGEAPSEVAVGIAPLQGLFDGMEWDRRDAPEGPLLERLLGSDLVWVQGWPLTAEDWSLDPKHAGVELANLPFEAAGPARTQAAGATLSRRAWRRSPGNALVPEAGQVVLRRDEVRRPAEAGDGLLRMDLPTRAGALAKRLALGRSRGPVELKIGDETRRAVVGLAPFARSYQVQLPDQAVLDLALGVRTFDLAPGQGAVRLRRDGAPAVRFLLHMLREGGEPELLLDRTLMPNERERYLDQRIELDAEPGEVVRFTLACQPEEGDWRSVGFWAEPTVWSRAQEPAPNLIVLLLDTLRADRLGCYGWERAQTPFLDGLAERGVRFADAMSAASWTLPAHASLFTSTYSSQHGLWKDVRLSPEQRTVAEVLRAGGYRTAAFAEGGFLKPEHGFARGFERFVSSGRECSETFDLAADWIEEREGPFFAFVHTYKVHAPYDPAPEYMDALVRSYAGDTSQETLARVGVNRSGEEPDPGLVRYLSDLYDAEIAELDVALAALFDRLEASGALGDTLVIVTSDHGEEFFEHGAFAHGASLYQEQLHVPMIAHWKGHLEGGAVVSRPVHTVDVAPTLVGAAGLGVPAGWEGLGLGLPEPEAPRPLFTPMRVRWADGERRGERAVAIREGRWKYIDYPSGLRVLDPQEGPRLYNLDDDPGELHNLLAGAGPEEWAQRAAALWEAYPELDGILPFELGEKARGELQDLGYVGGDD